jgi:anti-sigma-K factor RskA
VTSSNGTTSGHPLDDLAAYALDALDDTERRAVADHLADCDDCRDELSGHHEALAALTATSRTVDDAPPPAVWQRVAASIGAPDLDLGTPEPLPDLPPLVEIGAKRAEASDRTTTTTSGTRPSPVRWFAAAAACLVLGGVAGFVLGRSGTSTGDENIGTLAQRASDEPGGVLATLDDSAGQPVARVASDAHGAYMVLEGLPDLPEGRAYQLWSLTGPEPVSLGMLGRDGTNTVAFRLPPTITELAISVEPTSGEVAPSGDFRAAGSITRS